jgi:hypothetical protein
MVVWVGDAGVDEGLERELQRVGVDHLVRRRGTISLAAGAPVLRLSPEPPLAGVLPAGLALVVEGAPADLDPSVADALWAGLAAELGDATPVELILDMPVVPPGFAAVVSRLAKVAGVPVVPLVLPRQLDSQDVVDVVQAAGQCVVPTHGSLEFLRTAAEPENLPIGDQLAQLAQTRVRVRPAVVIRPLSRPVLERWGDDLDPLSEAQVATISTSSALDRTFLFERQLDWSGRTWAPGDRLALQWMDTARLDASLREIGRLSLPELGGWDLVDLPEAPRALGMGHEAMVRYLAGDGPEPEVTVEARRSLRNLSVRLTNSGPFVSTVSAYGNWVEVSVEAGNLVAEDRGSFDRVLLGTRQQGEWEQVPIGGADAARFLETYLAPDEVLETGTIRLPTSRSRARVRWRLVLSNGTELAGELER